MKEKVRERGSTTQNNNTGTQMHAITLQSRLKDADPKNESTPFNTARLKWALSMRERQNSWPCLPVDCGARHISVCYTKQQVQMLSINKYIIIG